MRSTTLGTDMADERLWDWLVRKGDWLAALIVVAIFTSTAIGLKDRATGGAIAVSNLTASLTAVAAYPFLERWGYGGPFVLALGLLAGACGIAAFGVLTSLRDMITRRREKIAGNILDRVAPATEDKC